MPDMILRGALCLFLFLTIVAVGLTEDQKEHESSLARIWIDRAANLLENPQPSQQDIVEANAALVTAEEFQTPGPDALYLGALIALKGHIILDDVPVRRAYDLSLASLNFDPLDDVPVRISFEKRAFLYASLALRLKEYSAYLDHYSEWPRGKKDSIPLLYAAARSALYLGLNNQAIDLVHHGESLVMENDELTGFELDLSHSQSAFWAIAVAAGDEKFMRNFDSARHRWGPDMEEAMIPWILSGIVQDTVIREIQSSLSASARETADAVIKAGVLTDVNGDLALARLLGESFSLERSITGYTGTLIADSEYDGYEEEHIKVVNGEPVYRVIDLDQDGRYDWEIDFMEGNPVQVRLDGGRQVIKFARGMFPEVLSMHSNNGTMNGEAVFHPGAFSWDPGDGDSGFGALSKPNWQDDDLWPFIKHISLQEEMKNGTEVGELFTWLNQGYPIKTIEVRYLATHRDEPLWIRELLFREGIVTAGRRSLRKTAGTGSERLWELYERYENGELVGLAWDPGMKGTPLYLKDWALGTYLQIQVWNLEADNWMDVRRLMSPGVGENIRELVLSEAKIEDILPWTPGEWYPWE